MHPWRSNSCSPDIMGSTFLLYGCTYSLCNLYPVLKYAWLFPPVNLNFYIVSPKLALPKNMGQSTSMTSYSVAPFHFQCHLTSQNSFRVLSKMFASVCVFLHKTLHICNTGASQLKSGFSVILAETPITMFQGLSSFS